MERSYIKIWNSIFFAKLISTVMVEAARTRRILEKDPRVTTSVDHMIKKLEVANIGAQQENAASGNTLTECWQKLVSNGWA